MQLPLVIAIIPTLLFGVLAIIYTLKEHQLKLSLIEKEKNITTSFINTLEDAVCMISINNHVTAVNKIAKDLLKLQSANPTLPDILSSLPNTYNFADKIQKAITSKQKIEEKEVRLEDKSLNITIYPVPEIIEASNNISESKVVGALLVIHDMTYEKTLSKMKQDFTNIIVHELRSPLTSIKASSEMLSGENNLTDEEKKRLISIINEQTGKMLDEVSLILDAAKLDSGLFTIQKANGDLKKVIEDTVNSLRSVAENKFINLVINIDPFIPQLIFDSYHIRRVINNLLTNSFKFTPRGGTVTVHAWRSTDKILVDVTDTGSGIPLEKQHLCFTKFAQIKTPDASVGTGLGLYTSKGIINAHGGTISLKSELGKGTIITFTLPYTTAVQNAAPNPSTPEQPLNPLAN